MCLWTHLYILWYLVFIAFSLFWLVVCGFGLFFGHICSCVASLLETLFDILFSWQLCMRFDLDYFLLSFLCDIPFSLPLKGITIQNSFSNHTDLSLQLFSCFKTESHLFSPTFIWTFSFFISVIPVLLHLDSFPRSFAQCGALSWQGDLVVLVESLPIPSSLHFLAVGVDEIPLSFLYHLHLGSQ